MRMAMSDDEKILNAHYASRDLAAAILAGLRAGGKGIEHLTPDDLAAVDQFHAGRKPSGRL
jgi:hypothetical protein